MRPARRPLAASLLAAAALAAGCGGDPEASNAYVDDVTAAQRAYLNRFDQVSKRLRPASSLEQDRAALTALGEANDTFREELRGIEPPEAVGDEHAKLVGVVEAYGGALDRAGEQLGSGSEPERAQARTDLATSVSTTSREIAAAVQAINEGLQD